MRNDQAEGRLTQSGKLCATPFGVDVVGITELVALTGALVGGRDRPATSPADAVSRPPRADICNTSVTPVL